jgi:hypothetical protein
MALGRELIYSTFFSQITTLLLYPAGPFNYMGRRSIGLGKLANEQYPAFLFLEAGEDYDRKVLFRPARVTLFAKGIIQSLHGQIPDESMNARLNDLADIVEDAIQAACSPTAQNTLNGLVQQAWINNRQVTIPPGYSNRWAEQILGIEIVLPHSR